MPEFQKRLNPVEQGFSLVEVLVAILITTFFVSVAMQAIVVAAIFKVKAQEYAEATTWIKEDLESTVSYQASTIQFVQTTLAANSTAVPPAPPAPASSILINTPNAAIIASFPVNGMLKVGSDPNSYKITGVSVLGATTMLNISPSLGTLQLENAAVVATTKCNPANINVGLAGALRDKILAAESSPATTTNPNFIDVTKYLSLLTTKSLTRRRTTTLSTTFPHSVLEIKYEVSPGVTFNSSKVIARFDTEVIPNVAFQCP